MNWYRLSQIPDPIIAAAIKLDGKIFSVPKPGRHHDIIHKMVQDGVKPHAGIQGFVTQSGKFVDRQTGAKIAISNGQVSKLLSPPELFSEDLW